MACNTEAIPQGLQESEAARRVVWLIMMLTDRLEPFYFCTSELKQQGHIRNRIVGKLVIKAIKRARDIPDSHVIPCPPQNGMKMALVSSQSRNLCFHEVNGWDKDICTCTCGSSIQGNVCKHQIKCLLFLGGFSEVDLQRRLGTHWGTISGSLENIDPNYLSTNAEVFGLDLPVQTLSSDSEDDDCVVLPTPDVALSRLPKQRTLGEFQKEVGNLYAQVSHSTYLCQQAFEFVVEAVGRALALKASSEMHSMVREDDIHTQPFVPLPGNDSSLKRRKDFMERFISKRRVQHKGQDRVEHDWTEINDDNRFEILPSQKMTMQEALDRATHESLDLNVSFNMTIQQSNGVPAAPSKRRTNRRAVQRLFKEQVGVETQPPDVIIIE
ncbi:hypothetical protein R1sor_007801 [Riccia sorocarpa]|uniref:SWIM-type domain-containing protein n=1 Tax=Riccia sorocarpa TaxID=122646 RepID=A0ABD3HV52_9MARC